MRFWYLGLAFVLLSSPALAQQLYVQSAKAKLLQGPNFKSAVVAKVNKGTELETLGKQGGWYQVKAGAHTGWVSRLLVSERPPMAKVRHIGSDESLISGESRRRASTVATAGAARGLSADQRARDSRILISDFHAVKQMEVMEISESEVARFLKEGEVE